MQNLLELSKDDLPIGYNDKLPSHILSGKYCTMIQNGFLDSKKIIQRYGYSMIGNDTGENKPNLLLYPFETGSYKQILKINDNAAGTAANLFYWSGSGNWVKVASPTFTAGKRYCAEMAFGKCYITNGFDTVKRWDGTTLVDMPAIPITNILKWFHDYMWALNSSGYKSRAFFSNKSDPETWGASDFFDVSQDDGDFITGCGTLKDELVFGKNYHTYSFQGWTEPDFSTVVLNEKLSSYGAASNDSFQNIGNDLLFMSYGGDIPHVRSLQTTKMVDTEYGGIVTGDIEGTMNGLSKAQLNKSATLFDGRRMWLFVPNGSSTFNDLALNYDTVTKGWTKHTGIYAAHGCVSSASGRARLYFGDSRNSKVYIFDTSTSDDGNAIDFQFITREYEPDFRRLTKFKYLFVKYGTGINSNLYVYGQPNASLTWDSLDTIPLTGQNNSVFSMTFPFSFLSTDSDDWRVELPYSPLHSMSYKFQKNDIKEPVTIFMYNVMGQMKSIRDFDST